MRLLPALFLLLAAVAASAAGPRRMAVTIDDLPWVQGDTVDDAHVLQHTAQLLRSLQRHRVPAIGFVNASGLYDAAGALRPARAAALEQWLDAGLELGNHSWSHPSLHRTALADWLADVERGETWLRAALAERGQRLAWFRHPYLHTGRDAATRAAASDFLAGRRYRIAPVTIDNGEWIYALAYRKALAVGDRATADWLGADYLDYMIAKTQFFEAEAQALLGRPMSQILLLHANDLNARFADPLLQRLAKSGWQFVTLAEAANDPAYRERSDTFHGAGGISWIHRWALTEGRPREFFAGEPEVPRHVLELAGVEGE